MKIYLIILLFLLAGCMQKQNKINGQPYNILFIMVDDEDAQMNELMHEQMKTPAFKKLAEEGILFRNAHCAVPACAPSRTALLTGVAAHNSGSYYNNHNLWMTNSPIKDFDNLPAYFKKNGYLTAGYGKIFHPSHDKYNVDDWSDGYFKGLNVSRDNNLKHDVLERVQVFSDMWSIGKLPDDWDLNDTTKMLQDTRNALRAIEIIKKPQEQPFFIALGIYRPHVPFYVPGRYFNMYPLEEIDLPAGYLENDLDDVPECAQWVATRRGFHQEITERGLWKQVLQAKMASITYADDQIGRVLQALDHSPHKDNTIVVWVGDNGFHTGQKEHWSKFALWEKATQVPMVVRIPGQSQSFEVTSPVSLLDIYPTLIELTGLKNPEHPLDGISLVPVMERKAKDRGSPVIVTHGKNNHAVISEEYHYIQYRNGAEELYQKSSDPYQWKNLASQQEYASQIEALKKYLPKENRDNLPFEYGNEESKGWDPEIFN